MTTLEETSAGLAERYVIGALMREPAVLAAVQKECDPTDFADMRLGDIYAGIGQLASDRVSVDYLTVFDNLARWDVRGIELTDLARWQDEVPSAAAAGYYASMVREHSLRRAMERTADHIKESARSRSAMVELEVMDAVEKLKKLLDRRHELSRDVRMLRDVLDVPAEADVYEWVIPHVLERRDRLMLTGSEGGGKSTMLRQLAVLSSAGVHPFTFMQMPPVRVLVVDAENSERQWRRAVRDMADRAAQNGVRDPRHHLALECTPKIDITHAADLGMVHRRIDEVKPDLLLIGPLYRLIGGKPIDKDTEVAPVLSALDSLRDRDVAMLIEAHAGHASSQSGERDLRPRGSSALLGWPEFGLGLRRDKQVDVGGRVKFSLVRWRGDRDARAFPTKFARGSMWPWEPTVQL